MDLLLYMVLFMIGMYLFMIVAGVGFSILGGIMELILGILYGISVLIGYTIRKITGRENLLTETFSRKRRGISTTSRRSTSNMRRSIRKSRRSTSISYAPIKKGWGKFIDFFREDDK